MATLPRWRRLLGATPRSTSRRAALPTADSLVFLPAGQPARITAVTGGGEVQGRLLELGFTPGCAITVLAAGPLGGPIAVSCRGAIMALRRSEAACIRVE